MPTPTPFPPAKRAGGSVPPRSAAPTPAQAVSPSGSAPVPGAIAPRILSIATSPAVVHDGDVVRWTVRTSPDVVGVSAHVLAYSFALQRRRAGSFALSFSIPRGVPFFFHRTYDLDVVARTAAGATATRTIGVIFR